MNNLTAYGALVRKHGETTAAQLVAKAAPSSIVEQVKELILKRPFQIIVQRRNVGTGGGSGSSGRGPPPGA